MIGDVVIDPQMKDHVLSWAEPFMVVVRRLEPAVKLLVQWDHVMGLCNRFESTTNITALTRRTHAAHNSKSLSSWNGNRLPYPNPANPVSLSGSDVWASSFGTGLSASLKPRLTPGFSPFRAPYAECSIMPSTRLYASVRLRNRTVW